MYERFRVRVETQQDSPERPHFQMPPPLPEAAGLAQSPPDQRSDARQDIEQGTELEGVYIISVAARILDMHPQTLRKYERLGLISPGRTVGMLRLYSREDIRKVWLIRHLMENLGLNLAGVEFALNLVQNLQGFRRYLQANAAGTPMEGIIEPAMAQLLRNLNLPAEE